ncbi:alkaline phosphatase family protein [Alcaligenes sp. DN25]|uniref:alkaline phosphatase family protein n=1 Tax=Alcaligenes TaxID=507 RepID=UPI00202EDAF7|nr:MULTISPECIES: alkaline phosphatase family protein [Alcaligenes]URW82128.1 alkaline phosphatase family protein [Alcaligenes sp. DN25]WEA66948.1 alkaline phosphatase family protein [Alcaligenes faecalis]
MRHAHMASPLSQGPGFPPPSATRYLNAAQAGCLQHPPVGRAGRSKTGLIKALAVASLSAALAACGSSETSSGPATAPETPTNPVKPDTPSTRHALIIDLDGATYRAVQQGMAAGSLPNLAKLNVQLAYSGGVVGTPSQQANLDMPGWASLLTGTWANRHGVVSTAPDQVLRQNSLFHSAQPGQNAAAVASSGLAHLLKADHDAERLHELADCSAQAVTLSCVSTQAMKMIEGNYRKVLVQYRSAKDAALDFGVESPDYLATLSKLDKEIGTLIAATAKQQDRQWLIVVTGNHGLSEHGQDNGLPLLSQSATFLAFNQSVNTGEQGIGASLPQTLTELYQYNSLVDVAPTVMRYLDTLPPAAEYKLDGSSLLGPQAVSNLNATVVDNNSSSVAIKLDWKAPADAPIDILRDGQVIASRLPAGTQSYTDNQLTADLSSKGTYQFDYTVQAGSGEQAAWRNLISPPISYLPPVPLATTLRNGLLSYYPFSATLPPVDAQGNSSMAPASADLPSAAGVVVPGPFSGTHGLLVDTNHVTVEGLEGYRMTPTQGFDISTGSSPQFTIGFWYQVPQCIDRNNVTILSNKNYVSGGNAGVAIGLFSSSTKNQCGVAFNIGSGGVRADGPTNPYTQIPVGRWVYIAFAVDGVAKKMNMQIFDPVIGQTTQVAAGKSTGAVDLSKLSPYPQWGIGDDGTGKFLMNKCNGSVTPPYTVGKCAVAPPTQQMFGDLAMWNRVLSDEELQSIYWSNKPLSSLSTH